MGTSPGPEVLPWWMPRPATSTRRTPRVTGEPPPESRPVPRTVGRRVSPLRQRIASLYERFGVREAAGRSALYGQLARAVAHDRRTLNLLAGLPELKQQPNLLFAAVRFLYGTANGPDAFLALVHAQPEAIAAEMRARSTQTNEPGRCATLLPALARLPQPLALLEVGAAAGLCLLPDHYAYDYGGRRVAPTAASSRTPLVLRCRVNADTPLPERNVEVAWRAGLDLDPVDLEDDADLRWLEALIWPGQEHRLPALHHAWAIARSVRPRVEAGDLRTELMHLAADAPPDATLVVFHSAVLAYVLDAEERAAFARAVKATGAVWIANERPAYLPELPETLVGRPPDPQAFLLSIDSQPVAWADPYGTALTWRHGR